MISVGSTVVIAVCSSPVRSSPWPVFIAERNQGKSFFLTDPPLLPMFAEGKMLRMDGDMKTGILDSAYQGRIARGWLDNCLPNSGLMAS
jgi:hypothetical protein